MLKVNVFEAKARLSELMAKAVGGERVVICRRNEPLVELTPVGRLRADARPMGLARGRGSIDEGFFEPMSEDELRAFEDGAVYPEPRTKPASVSEAGPRFSRSTQAVKKRGAKKKTGRSRGR